MPYSYQDMRPSLFTYPGSRTFAEIQRQVKAMPPGTTFSLGDALRFTCGDSWVMMASIDKLVEDRTITQIATGSMTQYNFYKKL